MEIETHFFKNLIFLETKPVTTVYCEAGKWKGEPDRGFWCYNRPEKPGPSGINACWLKIYKLNCQ